MHASVEPSIILMLPTTFEPTHGPPVATLSTSNAPVVSAKVPPESPLTPSSFTSVFDDAHSVLMFASVAGAIAIALKPAS